MILAGCGPGYCCIRKLPWSIVHAVAIVVLDRVGSTVGLDLPYWVSHCGVDVTTVVAAVLINSIVIPSIPRKSTNQYNNIFFHGILSGTCHSLTINCGLT